MAERILDKLGALPPMLDPSDFEALKRYAEGLPNRRSGPTRMEQGVMDAARDRVNARARAVSTAAIAPIAAPYVIGAKGVTEAVDAIKRMGSGVRPDEMDPADAVNAATTLAGLVTGTSFAAKRPSGSIGMGGMPKKGAKYTPPELPNGIMPKFNGKPFDDMNPEQVHDLALLMNGLDIAKAKKHIEWLLNDGFSSQDEKKLLKSVLKDYSEIQGNDKYTGEMALIYSPKTIKLEYQPPGGASAFEIQNPHEIFKAASEGVPTKSMLIEDPEGMMWPPGEKDWAIGKEDSVGWLDNELAAKKFMDDQGLKSDEEWDKILKGGWEEAPEPKPPATDDPFLKKLEDMYGPGDQVVEDYKKLGPEGFKKEWQAISDYVEQAYDIKLPTGTGKPGVPDWIAAKMDDPILKEMVQDFGHTSPHVHSYAKDPEKFKQSFPDSYQYYKDYVDQQKASTKVAETDPALGAMMSYDSTMPQSMIDVYKEQGWEKFKKAFPATAHNVEKHAANVGIDMSKAAKPQAASDPFYDALVKKYGKNDPFVEIYEKDGAEFFKKNFVSTANTIQKSLDNAKGAPAASGDPIVQWLKDNAYDDQTIKDYQNWGPEAFQNGYPNTYKKALEGTKALPDTYAKAPEATYVDQAPTLGWTPTGPAGEFSSKLPPDFSFFVDGTTVGKNHPDHEYWSKMLFEHGEDGLKQAGAVPVFNGDVITNVGKIVQKSKDGVPSYKLYIKTDSGTYGGVKPEPPPPDPYAHFSPEEAWPNRYTDLPLDDASRLARAQEMGFNTDKVLYHGMPKMQTKRWDGLGLKNPETKNETGLFLTDRPDISNRYAGSMELGENSLPLHVRSDKTKVIDKKGASYSSDWMIDEISKAWKEGHDLLEIRNMHDLGGNQTQWVVRNPAQLRSKFAVFDPKYKDSHNLLRSVAPMMLASPFVYNALAGEEEK